MSKAGQRHGLLDQAGVQRGTERKDVVVEVVPAVVQGAAAGPRALADAQVGARLGLQHERKVLSAHAGLQVAHHMVRAHQRLGHVAGELRLSLGIDGGRVDALVVHRGRAPKPRATALHISLRRFSTISCTTGSKVRTVPTMRATPGSTLKAPRSPACTAHRLSTALSIGRTLRETMLCAAVMMCAATSTTSTVW